MAEGAPARRLIVVGVSRCADGSDELTKVPEDVERLVSTLASPQFGYEHVLKELSRNPASHEVLQTLSAFFHSSDRTGDEVIVVYCAGHGVVRGPWFYLACADTTDDLIGTGFPMDSVLRMMTNSKVKFVLLILDTCFAGAGATEMMRGLDEIERARARSNDASFHVLASARSRELARDGLFTATLCDALVRAEGNDSGRFLSLGDVADQINRALDGGGFPQRAKRYGAGAEPFFANPEWARRLTRRTAELANFWEPHARGGPGEAGGWHFTGRDSENARILRWLRDGTGGLVVLTGPPGVGKSAILGRLVMLSDPERRYQAPLDELLPETVPPPDFVSLAILAHRKATADVAKELADRFCPRATPVEDVDELISTLAGLGRRMVIVIDGIDDARDPIGVVRGLVSRLSTLPNVTTVIAARAELLIGMPASSRQIDLGATKPSQREVAAYVERLLGEASEAYRTAPGLARRAGAMVARRADGNYLVARLAAAALADDEEVDEGAWSKFPVNLDAAFDAYFHALGGDRAFVEDMLRPLAFAEGEGLPQDLWPALASRASGVVRGGPEPNYGPSDVVRLLGRAASFVQARATEDGGHVFRLFHGALEHHFRKVLGREVQSAFVDFLVAHAFPENDYARCFLASHARAARRIDDLATSDCRFLVEAEPRSLVEALTTTRTPGSELIGRVYAQAFHLLVGRGSEVRVAYLEFFALLNGSASLAAKFAALDYRRRFRPAWSWYRAPHAHRIVGRHRDGAVAVGAHVDEEDVLYASAGGDGTVQIGALGRAIAEIPAHEGPVAAACVCASSPLDEPVFVTLGQDGALRRWSMRRGIEMGPLARIGGAGVAVVGATMSGRPAALAADADGRISGWTLHDGTRLAIPEFRTDSIVQCMAVVPTASGEILVCGDQSGLLTAFDLAHATLRGCKVQAHDMAVTGIAVLEDTLGVRIATCGDDGKIAIWAVAASGLVPLDERRHEHAFYAVASDRRPGDGPSSPSFAAAGADGLLRVHAGPGLGEVLEPRRGHSEWIRDVSLVRTASGPKVFSAGGDGTVRLWGMPDASDGLPPIGDVGDAVHGIAICTFPDGTAILVAGGPDGRLRTFDVATGRWLDSRDGRGRIHAIAAVSSGGSACVAVVGEGPVRLHRIDHAGAIGDARPLRAELIDEPIHTVAARMDTAGNIHVAASGMDGRLLAWERTDTPARLVSGPTDDPVSALSYSPRDGGLAVCRRSGELSLIDDRGEPLAANLGKRSQAAAFLDLDGNARLAVGCGHGIVRLLDPGDLQTLGELRVPGAGPVLGLGAHRGSSSSQASVIAAFGDGSLSMVEWQSGFVRLTVETGASTTSFARRGSRAVLATLDGLVALDLL